MINYEQLIISHFSGNTPKEKYEDMTKLSKEYVEIKGKIENLKTFFTGLSESQDSATLGNLRSVINAYASTFGL